jgi:hypothetical protein
MANVSSETFAIVGFWGLYYGIAASLFYMEVVKVGIAVGGDYVGA